MCLVVFALLLCSFLQLSLIWIPWLAEPLLRYLTTPVLPLSSAHLTHINTDQLSYQGCSSSPSFLSWWFLLMCSAVLSPTSQLGQSLRSQSCFCSSFCISSALFHSVPDVIFCGQQSVSLHSHTLNIDHKCNGNIYFCETCEL